MTPVATIAAVTALDLAVALIVGTLATLAGQGPFDAAARAGAGTRRLLRGACGLGLVAGLALGWLQAIAMTELAPLPALAQLPQVLAGTHFGRALSLTMASIAVLLALAWMPRAGADRRWQFATAAAFATLAGARAASGHAGASGEAWPLLLAGVHLFAMGLWSGCVFVAALEPGVDGRSPTPAAAFVVARARRFARLSSLATAALALVLATGALQAWRTLEGHWAPLASSAWGHVLDAKLALVALAVLLGGINRFGSLPTLVAAAGAEAPESPAHARALARFVCILRVEGVVLFAVLVAAATLANMEPPST
jgi:putative copper resistance protein D